MIITCVQPCFIPWVGYFEQMLLGEVFIYLDDVQYTKKDWRNRNRLLSPNGVKNVYVPISNASRDILINEAAISYSENWEDRLLNQLLNWYKKAPFYSEVISLFEPIILSKHDLLVDLNYQLNQSILDYLESDTRIERASSVPKSTDSKNERVIELCEAFNGTLLYDGKSAASFIDLDLFKSNEIDVIFQDYQHEPYNQLFTDSFEPYLSIVDLLMNQGKRAKEIILNNKFSNTILNERREKVSGL